MPHSRRVKVTSAGAWANDVAAVNPATQPATAKQNCTVLIDIPRLKFLVALWCHIHRALTFAVWYAFERTLSIHTIVTRRRELFYWATILCTFALGTAAGDLATEALSLGFNVGVLAFGTLIGLIAAAYYLGANAVLMDAFNTDVRPLLAEVRQGLGLDPEPMAAYARSGYGTRIAAERVGGRQAGWGA